MSRAIRRCYAKDLIWELDRECFPGDSPYWNDSALWWVVYDPHPVAFAGLLPMDDFGFLCRAGVLPSHRGQGLQRELIKRRLKEARRLGLKMVITYTMFNPASANSLIACGFRMYTPEWTWGGDTAQYWRKYL